MATEAGDEVETVGGSRDGVLVTWGRKWIITWTYDDICIYIYIYSHIYVYSFSHIIYMCVYESMYIYVCIYTYHQRRFRHWLRRNWVPRLAWGLHRVAVKERKFRYRNKKTLWVAIYPCEVA